MQDAPLNQAILSLCTQIIQPLDSNIKMPLSDEVRRGFFVDSIPVLTGGIKSFLL